MLGTKRSFKGATLACRPPKEQIPVVSRASNVLCVKPVSLKTLLTLKATIRPLSVMEAGRHTLMRHARRLESTLAELQLKRHGWRHEVFTGSQHLKLSVSHQGQHTQEDRKGS